MGIQMFRKLIFNFILFLCIICYLFESVAANPVPIIIHPEEIFLSGFLLLFIINFPINSIMYIGLIHISFCLLFLLMNKEIQGEKIKILINELL